MPDMDGLEVAESHFGFQKNEKDTPIIFLSER